MIRTSPSSLTLVAPIAALPVRLPAAGSAGSLRTGADGIAMINPGLLLDGDLGLKPAQPRTPRYAVRAHDGPAPVAALAPLAKRFRAASRK